VSQAAVSVTTSATKMLAENYQRCAALIYHNGAQMLYWGTDNTLTIANGMPLAPGTDIKLESTGPQMSAFYFGDIYGIVEAGTADVRVVELVTTR